MRKYVVVHKKSKKIAVAIHATDKGEKVIHVYDNLKLSDKLEQFADLKKMTVKYDYYSKIK